jgi:hypothetical protein
MPASNLQSPNTTSEILRYTLLLVCIAVTLGLAVRVQRRRSSPKSVSQIDAAGSALCESGSSLNQYLADGNDSATRTRRIESSALLSMWKESDGRPHEFE